MPLIEYGFTSHKILTHYPVSLKGRRIEVMFQKPKQALP